LDDKQSMALHFTACKSMNCEQQQKDKH